MKDNEEFDMLLNEIPHATSVNLQNRMHLHLQQQQQQNNLLHHHQNQNGIHGYEHVHDGNGNVNGYFHGFRPKQVIHGMYHDVTSYHRHCNSPVSGLSLQSGGSSSSGSLSGLEETKPQTPQRNTHYLNEFRSESKLPISSVERNFLDDVSSEYKMDLSEYLHNLSIKDDQDKFSNIRGYPNGNFQFSDPLLVRTNNGYVGNNGFLEDKRRYSSDNGRFNDPFPASMMAWDDDSGPALLGLQERSQIGTLSGSSYIFPDHSNYMCPYSGSSVGTPRQQKMEHLRYDETLRNFGFQEDALFLSDSHPIEKIQVPINFQATAGPFVSNGFFGGVSGTPSSPHLTNPQRAGTTPNNWVPHSLSSVKRASDIEAFSGEGSWIIQGSSLNSVNNKKSYRQREHKKLPYNEKVLELDGLSHSRKIPSMYCKYSNNSNSPSRYCSLIMPPKYDSLWAFEGNIYSIAKDQNGCRFLQRKFDEGTLQEKQMIFDEIIDHVVELMINPFGNYLIQKLLDVCNEEQRMQILIMVTSQPNQLVKISLNTHGTRVVQKLIDTLKTREQISRVIAALEPGFLHLMKDTNGNHVVLRCLQCLSSEDNKFIFYAAARFCVDIATHQHGCCVLQKCIDHSTGGRREKLLAEISSRGLYLAQDAYGNYVIQHVVEQQSTSANATLHSQFVGSYISLSLQKFSSHVVETCLRYFNEEEQSQIVHELLSFPRFEHLVQDEYANYVILSGLRYCKGSSVNALVGAIRPHIAALKTSPYCKQIYSKVVLRKRDKKM